MSLLVGLQTWREKMQIGSQRSFRREKGRYQSLITVMKECDSRWGQSLNPHFFDDSKNCAINFRPKNIGFVLLPATKVFIF
jgi:hypothetical protein